MSHLSQMAHPKQIDRDRGIEQKVLLPNTKVQISPEPYGVVLIVSPWSFPFRNDFPHLINLTQQ